MRYQDCNTKFYICMYMFFQVKILYTLEGSDTVIKTLDANVATLNFIARGLPGAPEKYKVLSIETPDGSVLEDWSKPPPDAVYILGILN